MLRGRGQSFQQFGDHPTYRDGRTTPLGIVCRVGPSFLHEGDLPLCFSTVHPACFSQREAANHA